MEPLISTSAERRFLPGIGSAMRCGFCGSGANADTGAGGAMVPGSSASSEPVASPERNRLNTGDYSAHAFLCQGFARAIYSGRHEIYAIRQFLCRISPNLAQSRVIMGNTYKVTGGGAEVHGHDHFVNEFRRL